MLPSRGESSTSGASGSGDLSLHPFHPARPQAPRIASHAPLLSPSAQSPPTTPAYRSKAGCVLCGLVAAAASTTAPPRRIGTASTIAEPASATTATSFLSDGGTYVESPVTYIQPFAAPLPGKNVSGSSSAVTLGTGGREVIFQDADITVYPAEGKEALCPDGRHIIIVLNQHAESVYELGPVDVPLLSKIMDVAKTLLTARAVAVAPRGADTEVGRTIKDGKGLQIGFVGNIARDPQSPHKHLHVHAMLGPIDTSLPGATFYRRNIIFGHMNWWSVEDLRAEIRESTSNNRVKSGYDDRPSAPIDKVPDAGAATGLPNALDVGSYKDRAPTPTSPSKGKHSESRGG